MSVRIKLWTRDEYDRLVAAGAFHAAVRVQLIQGEIVEMTPQTAAHAAAVELVQGSLQEAMGSRYFVRVQLPLALGEDSEPEPDLAVVAESPRTRTDRHPITAALVVEVADTTLHFDRSRKQEVYARAKIPEYWILNLADSVLEVYRDPQESIYRTTLRLRPGETIVPLASPATPLSVSDLLP